MRYLAALFVWAFSATSVSAWVSPSINSRSHTALASALPTTLDGQEIRGPITPLGNFVLVKVKDTLTATLGGVLLPDQSKERPTEGLVVEAGPGKIHPFTGVRITNPIKVGMSASGLPLWRSMKKSASLISRSVIQ